jgi:hypothetical protein
MQHRYMTLLLTAVLSVGTAAYAAEKKKDADHAKKAAIDHRVLAEAHTNAAVCLEAGKLEKDCHAQLAKDCKGLGIGKYCGLKHRH